MSMSNSLGGLLLNPQILQRANAIPEERALFDELAALAQRLVLNPVEAQALVPALTRAIDQWAGQLLPKIQPHLGAAISELEMLVQPLFQEFDEVVKSAGSLTTVQEVTALIGRLFNGVLAFVQHLSVEQLTVLVNQVKHLLADTLGLSVDGLVDQLRCFFSSLRHNLLSDSGRPEATSLRLACAAVIARIQREILNEAPLFPLNSTSIVATLWDALRQISFDKIQRQLANTLEKFRSAVGACTTLFDLAKPSPYGKASIGAAAVRTIEGGTYCWYASWVFRNRQSDFSLQAAIGISWLVPGYPDNEVWISADGTQVILRQYGRDDEILYENVQGNAKWTDIPIFRESDQATGITFSCVSRETMESWAQVAWGLAQYLKTVCHTVDLASSPKEYGSNIPQICWHLLNTLSATFFLKPLPSLLSGSLSVNGLSLTQVVNNLSWLAQIAGSFEGQHERSNTKTVYWATLAGTDVMNALTYRLTSDYLYDLILGALTVRNYGKAAEWNPGIDKALARNIEFATVFGDVSSLASVWLFFWLVPREDYGLPWKRFKVFGWWIWALIPSVVGHAVATMVGWIPCRTTQASGYMSAALLSFIKRLICTPLIWYLAKEGSTGQGVYHPFDDGQFPGYPDALTSPYRLPFKGGVSAFVGQAHMGVFSHNGLPDDPKYVYTPNIYACDFALDFDADVLAARDGVIVDYFDWVENDTCPETFAEHLVNYGVAVFEGLVDGQTERNEGNFVLIQHDLNPLHDRDVGGSPAVHTYAMYVHGKKGGVRDVFDAVVVDSMDRDEKDQKIAKARTIIGTRVKRGDVIMRAGCTGVSAHNHLHMEVRVRNSSFASIKYVNISQMKEYTIPFTFADIRHVIGRDGVPKAGNWYVSENEGE